MFGLSNDSQNVPSKDLIKSYFDETRDLLKRIGELESKVLMDEDEEKGFKAIADWNNNSLEARVEYLENELDKNCEKIRKLADHLDVQWQFHDGNGDFVEINEE